MSRARSRGSSEGRRSRSKLLNMKWDHIGLQHPRYNQTMALHRAEVERRGNNTTMGLREQASYLSEVLTDDENTAQKENQPNSDLKNLEASLIQSPTLPKTETVRISTKSQRMTPIDDHESRLVKNNEQLPHIYETQDSQFKTIRHSSIKTSKHGPRSGKKHSVKYTHRRTISTNTSRPVSTYDK